jgi:hypothetical protein
MKGVRVVASAVAVIADHTAIHAPEPGRLEGAIRVLDQRGSAGGLGDIVETGSTEIVKSSR